MAKILIGISGSIASIKILGLIHKLVGAKHQCKVIVTPQGLNFVTPTSIVSMGASVYLDHDLTNKRSCDEIMEHINLAKWADYILLTACTANTIAKIAMGMADNLLTSTVLASEALKIVIPAMNQQMWQNQVTKRNCKYLMDAGFIFWGPVVGLQACGDDDIGRMLEVEDILKNFEQLLNNDQSLTLISGTEVISSVLKGKKIVITLGATVEKIDPVRFISNISSGKMGYNLACVANKLGAEVTLICGKITLADTLMASKIIYVDSATEMLDVTLREVASADIFIGAAAVCDYKVLNPSSQKIKKNNDELTLSLILNPDIIKQVKACYPKLFVVGFAAETENLIDNATKKMAQKSLDMVIANDVSNNKVFGTDVNQVTIITKHGNIPEYQYDTTKELSKYEIAKLIFAKIVESYKLINNK